MKYKTWCISFISILLSLIILFATTNYILDPLVRYRRHDEGILSYYLQDEIYNNPGIARNYKYDSVLVGTSMMENTSTKEINELFNLDTVKLTYSGGTSKNMKNILDIAFKSDNNIKTVIWGLDEFQVFQDVNKTRTELPLYLYKDTHFEDYKYLLSGDIFYHYTFKSILGTLKGDKQTPLNKDDIWGYKHEYSKKITLDSFTLDEKLENVSIDYHIKNTKNNLQQNILPLVNTNKDTKFIFVFVPYSMLYWYNELEKGTFDATMYAITLLMQELLIYSNVEIYYFRNDFEITTNLDNYKDYSHYSPAINSYMNNAIYNGENRLTLDNYKQELEKFATCVKQFDYQTFIEE